MSSIGMLLLRMSELTFQYIERIFLGMKKGGTNIFSRIWGKQQNSSNPRENSSIDKKILRTGGGFLSFLLYPLPSIRLGYPLLLKYRQVADCHCRRRHPLMFKKSGSPLRRPVDQVDGTQDGVEIVCRNSVFRHEWTSHLLELVMRICKQWARELTSTTCLMARKSCLILIYKTQTREAQKGGSQQRFRN
jgi:hypothetical protein